MIELKIGAAYIRKSSTRSADANAHSNIEREVLALLDTAHTSESLSRRISRDRDAHVDTVREDVESAMRHLLHQELIELSPDS